MSKYIDSRILDNFKQSYPMIFNSACDFYSNGEFRVVAIMKDGTKYEYDELYHSSIRKLNNVDENGYEDLNESSWGKQLGINLKRILSLRGISQDELSKATGISKVSISQYINGSSIPSAYKLRNIAKALCCKPNDIIGF